MNGISPLTSHLFLCVPQNKLKMVAVNDTEKGCATADLITKYTYLLSTMPILSSLCGVTSSMFAVEGLFLNGYAIYVAQKFNQERSNSNARKVFFTSLWYLPCWMILFLLHSKKWHEGVDEEVQESVEEELMEVLKRKVDDVRQTGRELCPHEVYAFGTNETGNLNSSATTGNECPVKMKHAGDGNSASATATATIREDGNLSK
jgi:hypothetical protein